MFVERTRQFQAYNIYVLSKPQRKHSVVEDKIILLHFLNLLSSAEVFEKIVNLAGNLEISKTAEPGPGWSAS